MAIFEDEIRSATVRAVGEAHVIEVDKKSVEKRIADNPRLAVNLLKDDVVAPPCSGCDGNSPESEG